MTSILRRGVLRGSSALSGNCFFQMLSIMCTNGMFKTAELRCGSLLGARILMSASSYPPESLKSSFNDM